MLFGIMANVIGLPISLYIGIKARKNPILRKKYLRNMAFIPTIPLMIVVVTGYYATKNYNFLIDKYFGQLGDTDLDNFENYYNMYKGNNISQQA